MNAPVLASRSEALSAALADHPWIAQMHAGSSGALLLPSSAGVAQLRRHGRQALFEQLHAHLATHAIESMPLRLLDRMPGDLDTTTVDRLLASPRPDHAIMLGEHAQDERWTLSLQLPLELIHFDGHFQRAPVLPGVLQVGWALALAAPRLGTSMQCREMEAMKFQRLLHPGDRVALSLHVEADALDRTRGKLHFAYHLDGAHCSSGRLKVALAHD